MVSESTLASLAACAVLVLVFGLQPSGFTVVMAKNLPNLVRGAVNTHVNVVLGLADGSTTSIMLLTLVISSLAARLFMGLFVNAKYRAMEMALAGSMEPGHHANALKMSVTVHPSSRGKAGSKRDKKRDRKKQVMDLSPRPPFGLGQLQKTSSAPPVIVCSTAAGSSPGQADRKAEPAGQGKSRDTKPRVAAATDKGSAIKVAEDVPVVPSSTSSPAPPDLPSPAGGARQPEESALPRSGGGGGGGGDGVIGSMVTNEDTAMPPVAPVPAATTTACDSSSKSAPPTKAQPAKKAQPPQEQKPEQKQPVVPKPKPQAPVKEQPTPAKFDQPVQKETQAHDKVAAKRTTSPETKTVAKSSHSAPLQRPSSLPPSSAKESSIARALRDSIASLGVGKEQKVLVARKPVVPQEGPWEVIRKKGTTKAGKAGSKSDAGEQKAAAERERRARVGQRAFEKGNGSFPDRGLANAEMWRQRQLLRNEEAARSGKEVAGSGSKNGKGSRRLVSAPGTDNSGPQSESWRRASAADTKGSSSIGSSSSSSSNKNQNKAPAPRAKSGFIVPPKPKPDEEEEKKSGSPRRGDSLLRFLQGLGMQEFLDKFRAERLDLTTLTMLSDRDIECLGLPLGPRKRIQMALSERRRRLHLQSGAKSESELAKNEPASSVPLAEAFAEEEKPATVSFSFSGGFPVHVHLPYNLNVSSSMPYATPVGEHGSHSTSNNQEPEMMHDLLPNTVSPRTRSKVLHKAEQDRLELDMSRIANQMSSSVLDFD